MKHCSKCGKPRDRPGQGYCRCCHAAYMCRWRPTPEQKMKHAVRSRVAYALKTGRLKRQPCEVCGAKDAEAHHPDYSKPLEVMWLCVPHHGAEHKRMKEIENGELLQATG